MKTIIIYHANCSDGFTAAWVAHNYFALNEDVEFIATNYEKDYSNLIEKIRGNKVMVFDFSFPRAVMEEFNSIAASFEVHDHHKTSKDDCEGLPYCTFDLTKSGAVLAWEKFHGKTRPSLFVQYVQDRDLWQWKMTNSKEINAVIQITPKIFDDYATLSLALENNFQTVLVQGKVLLANQKAVIEANVKNATTMIIQEHRVKLINNPNLISETVEVMAQDAPFAAAFFMRQDGKFVFSLRSRPPQGIDVSAIAKMFPGGGGHPQAAGFTLDMPEFIELWKTIKPLE